MNNHAAILRSLVVYGICLPLAMLLGYLLTVPDSVSLGVFGVVLAILMVPVLLRFHYGLLLLSWNTSMVLFFIPQRPSLFIAMSLISFAICIGHRTLDKRFKFLSVPDISRPLIALFIIILFTAEATGGIGIRGMGSDVYGGKRYLLAFIAMMGYFALISRRVPVERAHFILALFFLPGLSYFIQDAYSLSGPVTRYLFFLFPPNLMGDAEIGVTRFGGLSAGSSIIFCYMLARYGIKGIFSANTPLRWMTFCLFFVVGLLGGYRSALLVFLISFGIQFYLEGIYRTKLFGIFLFIFLATVSISLPLMQRMPITIQRSFTFIPFLPLDPSARWSAEGSSEWRIGMWKTAVREIPQYLLIGKGFGMSARDFAFASDSNLSRSTAGDEWWGAMAAGDYHNGPLSVIITFGIWGMLAFLWLLAGCLRVLYNNYRYGDERLKMINTFLFSYFIARMVIFFCVVGGFSTDLPVFLGLVGLGICLNGGMASPTQAVPVTPAKTGGLANMLPRPKSAFSR